jgi:dihydropteroate synthase
VTVTVWRTSGHTIEFGPPRAAGIVNVTDDSFFSGARSGTPDQAIADGLALAEAGFELLDVGAVAARSGPPVAAEEEGGRLVPAIEGLAAQSGVPVLADTFSPLVAARAIEAGAAAINDIGGGQPEMLEAIAGSDCGYILMHIEGPPRVDRPPPQYDDVVDHLKAWFAEGLERCRAAGIDPDRVALDPGLDFDLTTDDGIEIMRRLGELRELGRPLFVALSRKDFLGAIAAGSWEGRLEPDGRGPATLAATALAVQRGAEMIRLHDVEALDAMRVAAAVVGRAA